MTLDADDEAAREGEPSPSRASVLAFFGSLSGGAAAAGTILISLGLYRGFLSASALSGLWVCAAAAALGLGLCAQARRFAEEEDDSLNWNVAVAGSWLSYLSLVILLPLLVFGGIGDG